MYCIYTRYIDACIYQGLNLRPHGSTPRSEPPNHFKNLSATKKKFKFIMFGMNYLGNSKFNAYFLFKIYSKATNKNMVLKLIQ